MSRSSSNWLPVSRCLCDDDNRGPDACANRRRAQQARNGALRRFCTSDVLRPDADSYHAPNHAL